MRECRAIPGVPSIVQYIRFEGGYKPVVAMPAVTCPPAHQSHQRLSRHIKVALTNLIFCTDVVNEPENGLNDGLKYD